jgi:Mrp family chromosome partitioning ATPase
VPAEPTLDNRGMEQTPLGAAWRFRWLVLLVVVLGGTFALLAANAIKSTQYQAVASLVVADPRTNTLFSSSDAQLSASRYVDDQVAILRSDSVAQRTSELIAESGLEIDANEIAEVVRVFTTESSEILVEYAAAVETTAVSTVNAVIEAYELVRREGAVRESASAIAQLEQSLVSIDAELRDLENQILVITVIPEQEQLDQQHAAAIARLAEIQPRLATATEEELVLLRDELADIDLLLDRRSQIGVSEANNPLLVQLYGEQSTAIQRRSALSQQRDELLVDTELLSGGISLSSPAQFAREIKTAVATITVFGAFLGLLAGSGIAYLLSLRRRKFAGRSEPGWVLKTSLLAEIPIFGDEGISSELPVLEYPTSASAESFRFAATALDLSVRRLGESEVSRASNPHTYLVTSPGPQEGKTVLTANLALAAARKGRSVLVIDADFGNQRLSELLRGEHMDGPGITEVVESGLDLATGTFSLGPPGPLDVMSRGKRPTNGPDFFSLPATHAFIAKVGKLYDIVLIDGPPMLHVAYTSILAQYVGYVVVVTRHGGSVTRLEDLAQRLELVGTPLAGYVYNGAPLRYEMTLTDGSLRDVLGEGISG